MTSEAPDLLTKEDREEIVEEAYRLYQKYQRGGARGQIITEWDGIESWLIKATEARLEASRTDLTQGLAKAVVAIEEAHQAMLDSCDSDAFLILKNTLEELKGGDQ